MQVRLRKYLSFLLLSVFLFPYIEKEMHAIEHANDFHCTEKSKVHYHEKEHQCTICDFNLSSAFTQTYFNERIQVYPVGTLKFCSQTESFVSSPAYSFLLRGPPSIS